MDLKKTEAFCFENELPNHLVDPLHFHLAHRRGLPQFAPGEDKPVHSDKKVQVGKDQEKAQSEKDSHSKNRGGKN